MGPIALLMVDGGWLDFFLRYLLEKKLNIMRKRLFTKAKHMKSPEKQVLV